MGKWMGNRKKLPVFPNATASPSFGLQTSFNDQNVDVGVAFPKVKTARRNIVRFVHTDRLSIGCNRQKNSCTSMCVYGVHSNKIEWEEGENRLKKKIGNRRHAGNFRPTRTKYRSKCGEKAWASKNVNIEDVRCFRLAPAAFVRQLPRFFCH